MTLSSVLLLAAWSTAADTPPQPAPVTPRSVLITDIKPNGVDAQLARQATHLLEAAFEGRAEYVVVSTADLARVVKHESTKSLIGCSDAQCAADLSRLVNADLVVTGEMGAVGKEWTLNLSLIDAAQAKVVQRAGRTFSGAKDLVAGVQAAAALLLGWAGSAQGPTFKLSNGSKISLAVLDLEGEGVNEQTVANLTQVLSTELKRVEGTSVIARSDVKSMMQLQEQKMSAGCDDASCLAEIGGALGVDQLVAGNVGKVGDTYLISLRLISVQGVKVNHRVFESFSGGEEQLIRATRHSGRRLLGVAEQTGSLTIAANEPDAEVFLDGKRIGRAPLPPVENIPEGPHNLHVVKAGFADHYGDVYVTPAESNAVWVPLRRLPVTPWYQRPLVLVGILVPSLLAPLVAAVVVGVLGAVAVGIVYVLVVRDGVTRTSLGTVEF